MKDLAEKIWDALSDLADEGPRALVKDRAIERLRQVIRAHDPVADTNEDLAKRMAPFVKSWGEYVTEYENKGAALRRRFILNSEGERIPLVPRDEVIDEAQIAAAWGYGPKPK